MGDSRKEFEDWCCTTFQLWVNTREGDGYDNKEIDSLWNGWQAGRQSVAKGKRTEMTEHKALSAFEQAKLQEEVEALHKQVVARDALLKAKDAALRDARASFLGLQPNLGGPISAQMGLAASRITKALALYTTKEN